MAEIIAKLSLLRTAMDKNLSEILVRRKDRLVSKFLKNKEPGFMDHLARILDDYFQENFESSAVGPRLRLDKNSYVIIAVGGYGRREQCIHSDIDLLFLFEKRVPREAESLIQEMVYPLWDIGLDVSPATRSLKECVNLAGKDFEILTPLLDGRFICGMSLLYSKLMEKLHEKIIPSLSQKIISWLIERNRARHHHFGDSSYLLEPNLKEGQGGLRDYHTLLWVARIKSSIRERRDLEYYGYLSHDEFLSLNAALSFIWDVRNRLHHLTGRKCDQLHMEYQKTLADALGFKRMNGQEPVERFLGELHGQMEFLKQQHLMFLYELEYNQTAKPGRKPVKSSNVNGIEVKEGTLHFTSSEEILKSPELLILIFKESARLTIPLGAEAKRLVKEFGYLINGEFRKSISAIRFFEHVLVKCPTPQVLDEMLSTGFLVQFIPEMDGIINRIQYNEYHIYPVDRHLLKTVQTIKDFDTPDNAINDSLWGELYNEVKNKKILLWAALLHDIGKGEPGAGHSEKGARIVAGLLTKMGFKNSDVETISFLVRDHLFLVKTATRRDINDEETAISCARKIADTERLKMLYLLSVADSLSTGPKAWNDWNLVLLRDLFLKIYRIIEKGELATSEAVESVKRKKDQVLSSTSSPYDRQYTASLFNVMSPRYVLYTPANDILGHVELLKSLVNEDVVWKVEKTPDLATRRVTICAKDRPGLFSKISGIFTLNGIDILDAQIYTWRNNTALDIFKVKPPPDQLFESERWSRAEESLKSALCGELDLGAALRKKTSSSRFLTLYTSEKPHQVIVDNHSSSFFTIIEVFTYDFPGLLFNVTDAIYRCGLDIRIAKIATNVDQIVGVFYVRDLFGQKADTPDQVLAIKAAITKVLPSP